MQAIVTAIAAICASQDAIRPGHFSSPNAQILMDQAVIKELNLSTDQTNRLRAMFTRLQMEQSKLDDVSRFKFPGATKDREEYVRNLVKEQRRSLQALEGTRKRREELRQEEEQAIPATLNPTQLRRFRQLELQRALPMVFKRKEIADQLSLSEEQRSGILEIGQRIFPSQEEREREQKQWDDQWDEVLKHGSLAEYARARAEHEAGQKEKYRKLREQALNEIMVLLTDEQKEKWSEMIGAKFDFESK